MTPNQADIVLDAQRQVYHCYGDWNLAQLHNLTAKLNSLLAKNAFNLDGAKLAHLDVAGACLILSAQKQYHFQLQNFSQSHITLIDLVAKSLSQGLEVAKKQRLSWLAKLGKMFVDQYHQACLYLNFIGQLTLQLPLLIRKRSPFRLQEWIGIIYSTGYTALPIIALLSFMIGVVMTYQMGLQLRNYGANIYIVDLLGLAILREFGPLLTAIMVAGRTGSAFTAQLGMMKINQEIDALNTMGIPPGQLLIWPRILGLVIALPLLTIWANIISIIGGMVTANSMLHITYYDFLTRFPNVIKLKNLLIGLGKAPIFAFIIASIGCFQGIQVTGSAESVGRNTTRSVVLSIFFIILADACFSVLFSKLKL